MPTNCAAFHSGWQHEFSFATGPAGDLLGRQWGQRGRSVAQVWMPDESFVQQHSPPLSGPQTICIRIRVHQSLRWPSAHTQLICGRPPQNVRSTSAQRQLDFQRERVIRMGTPKNRR